MNGGLPKWAIIVIVLAVIFVLAIIIVTITGICCAIRYRNEIQNIIVGICRAIRNRNKIQKRNRDDNTIELTIKNNKF